MKNILITCLLIATGITSHFGYSNTKINHELANELATITASQPMIPIWDNEKENILLEIAVTMYQETNLRSVSLDLLGTKNVNDIKQLELFYSTDNSFKTKSSFGKIQVKGSTSKISGNLKLSKGIHYFYLSISLINNPDLTNIIKIIMEAFFFKMENNSIKFQTSPWTTVLLTNSELKIKTTLTPTAFQE